MGPGLVLTVGVQGREIRRGDPQGVVERNDGGRGLPHRATFTGLSSQQ